MALPYKAIRNMQKIRAAEAALILIRFFRKTVTGHNQDA